MDKIISKKADKLSNKELINGLYETIWAISDIIGVNIEVAEKRIPEQHINAPELAKRLLAGGVAQVNTNLELLRQLEDQLDSGKIDA